MTKPTRLSFVSALRLPLLFAAVLLVPGIGPWVFGVPSALGDTETQKQSEEKGAESPPEKPQDQEPQVARGATLIRVPLPLSSDADTRILASLESVAMRSDANQRPVVILEFVPASVPSGPAAADANGALEPVGESKSIGQGTSFEKALSVSRWLSGPKGNRVKSVGYIASNLRGHAVLIALACEELVMLPDSEIGKSGIDETQVEPTLEQAYLDIAARRGMFPASAIRSMLDPSQSLVQLDLEGGGVEYTTLPELESKPREQGAWRERQLVPANQMASFNGQELRQRRWISSLVNQRELLPVALKLTGPIQQKPLFSLPRKPVHLKLSGVLHRRVVNRTLRAIDDAVNNQKADLVLIQLDSPGGNLDDSIRLAYRLAEIPSDKAEVIVYVSKHARGDAALIALAADAIYMAPDAVLGTGGEASINAAEIEKRKTNFLELAQRKSRAAGDLVGLVHPDAIVHDFLAADGRRMRTVPTWVIDDPQNPLWTKGQAVDYSKGIETDRAIAMGLASGRANDLESVAKLFGVDELPVDKQTSRIDQAIEWLASQRWLAYVCFLVGLICLSAELSTPGVGVPGLIAVVCFLIFFWMNLFQGTIEWLEILLIVAGIGCLLTEIFLLPGFGIFGLAGLVMLAAGLLLAGQSFTIPTNRYQLEKVVQGLGQMGLGMIVLLGALVVFHKQLAKLPMVRWFALDQPLSDKFVVAMERLDEDRQMLKGRFGTTMTRCNPHGKALLGDMVVDVVSKSGWIDEDIPIEVVDIKENQVMVRRRTI
jgi:membrane-bound ClpP family serine protease